MRLLIITTLISILVLNTTLGQGIYCQGCCGEIRPISYGLYLSADNNFEIIYNDKLKNSDSKINKQREQDEYYGLGKYRIQDGRLILEFGQDTTSGIKIKKIGNSDSLKIKFKFALSSFGQIESIEYGINIRLTKSKQPSDKDVFIYSPNNIELKRTFKGQQYIYFSFIGFQEIEYLIDEPGVYEMKVTLRQRANNIIEHGTTMSLKYDESVEVITLDTKDRKIKFTKRKCD